MAGNGSRGLIVSKHDQVRPPEHYHYLNQSGCTTLEGVDDADKFDALRLALEVVQIPEVSSRYTDIFTL